MHYTIISLLVCVSLHFHAWPATSKRTADHGASRIAVKTPAPVAYSKRRGELRKILSTFSDALIGIVREYEKNPEAPFLAISLESSKALKTLGCFLYELPGRNYLHIFERSTSGSLRCRRMAVEQESLSNARDKWMIYPQSWDRDQKTFYGNLCKERYGPRPLITPAASDALHEKFSRCCGVQYEVVRYLTLLLDMKTKVVFVDSEEYQNQAAQSLVMLDPFSLSLHEFARQIVDIHKKLNDATMTRAFGALDYYKEQVLVASFLETYTISKAVGCLKETESRIHSVLFTG